MLTAITGINWGDEGKGRMVDLISQEYDIVARYQGGNNAGHTVKNERGKFVLNLLPSGILRPDVVCVMGNGMVIDPHHLDGEINKLREQGIDTSYIVRGGERMGLNFYENGAAMRPSSVLYDRKHSAADDGL